MPRTNCAERSPAVPVCWTWALWPTTLQHVSQKKNQKDEYSWSSPTIRAFINPLDVFFNAQLLLSCISLMMSWFYQRTLEKKLIKHNNKKSTLHIWELQQRVDVMLVVFDADYLIWLLLLQLWCRLQLTVALDNIPNLFSYYSYYS